MNAEHDFFTRLNDAILLNYESFNRWERALLSEILNKVVQRKYISEKQKLLVIKILDK